MKQLGIFLLPPGWDASPFQQGVLHSILPHCRVKFAGTHLYTWVERGTVRVKCLAQEHKRYTTSPARDRIWIAWLKRKKSFVACQSQSWKKSKHFLINSLGYLLCLQIYYYLSFLVTVIFVWNISAVLTVILIWKKTQIFTYQPKQGVLHSILPHMVDSYRV